MTRKRLTLAYITNDSERKTSFRKRKKGLIKKVRELSTLCDVDACAIIYSPYDPEPEVWPSQAGAQAVLARFRNLPEMDRSKKTVNQESFTRQRIKKVGDQLLRLQKENKRREMEGFMYQCLAGMASLDYFDMRHGSAEMDWVINQTLREITYKMDELRVKGQDGVVGPPPPPPPPPPAAVTGDDNNMGSYLVENPTGAGGLGWAPNNF